MKKSSNKKQSSLFDKLKSFYQSRYGKMTLFFGFYFFFFLFLILNFNLNNTNQNDNENSSNNTNINENNSSNSNTNNNNIEKPTTWEFNTLIKDNYTYNYYINENGNNLSFDGKLKTNPLVTEYSYNYFLNLYNINQIIKNGKFLEKKELESGYQYNYEITNKSLGELLDYNEELSNELNKIIVYTDNNLIINKIDLDLSSYMQELNEFNEYKITLQYEKVEE